MRAVPTTLVALAFAALVWACSVGQGSGQVSGTVHLLDCGVDLTAYTMSPDFFSADFVDDPRTMTPGGVQNTVILRMQRGSYREGDSDGLSLLVSDLNAIQASMLGTPIEVGTELDSPVRMTFYLNETCESGFPREFWTVPGVLQATSGAVTFDSVYAPGSPDPDGENVGEFRGSFTDVLFSDPNAPTERFAILSGEFAFFYQRGRPAQRFP